MITMAKIVGITEKDVGTDLFAALVAIYPEGRDRHVFKLALPVDDSRTKEVLHLLDQGGKRPWTDKSTMLDRRKEYWLRLERLYDHAELSDCDYLELSPPYLFERDVAGRSGGEHGAAWRESGVLQLMQAFLRPDVDIARTGHGYVMPDRVRRILESRNLSHVLVMPTRIVRKYGEPLESKNLKSMWWELTSDVVLPPLTPAMDLRDRDGIRIVAGDLAKGCYRHEDLYVHPELHYRSQDLAKVQDFDLACTFEHFGGTAEPDTWLPVASKRLYKFCVELDLKTDWVPVRVD